MHTLQLKELELKRKEQEYELREEEMVDKLSRMHKALEALRLERLIAEEASQKRERTQQKVMRKMKRVSRKPGQYSLYDSLILFPS